MREDTVYASSSSFKDVQRREFINRVGICCQLKQYPHMCFTQPLAGQNHAQDEAILMWSLVELEIAA